MTVFQLFCDGTWAGEAEGILDARSAAETMIGEGSADRVDIKVDDTWIETAEWADDTQTRGHIEWTTSSLVRKYDGRVN